MPFGGETFNGPLQSLISRATVNVNVRVAQFILMYFVTFLACHSYENTLIHIAHADLAPCMVATRRGREKEVYRRPVL